MIKIYCVSDGDKHFAESIAEYIKRLGNSIQIISCKPCKKTNPEEIIQYDTIWIQEKIEEEKKRWAVIVLLSKEWKIWDTQQWKRWIQDKQIYWQDITFIIWGPYGLDEQKLQKIVDVSLSFGAVTMPHGLIKLVVLEQIYRCMQIITGKNYHY